MTDSTAADLKRRRRQLLRKLPPLDCVLRGSLIKRYKRCGNPNCRCADGQGHGPKYYLSVSYPGSSPRMDYVPQADYEAVNESLANYTQIREILEQISEINHELLRRREPL
ncbi:MAG TPA: DUF6788 family protein [Rubrivivax sp.]|nr:DUF6788 family protein [Rubrivivax sp.]